MVAKEEQMTISQKQRGYISLHAYLTSVGWNKI